jgi:hypothetical protein
LRERKRQPERRNKISIVTVGLPFFDQSIGRFRSGQTIADEVTVILSQVSRVIIGKN